MVIFAGFIFVNFVSENENVHCNMAIYSNEHIMKIMKISSREYPHLTCSPKSQKYLYVKFTMYGVL